MSNNTHTHTHACAVNTRADRLFSGDFLHRRVGHTRDYVLQVHNVGFGTTIVYRDGDTGAEARVSVPASTPVKRARRVDEQSCGIAVVSGPALRARCEDCGGSGVRRFGRGEILNGKWTGATGKCYRCNGVGTQSEADRVRNSNYDNYVRKYSL